MKIITMKAIALSIITTLSLSLYGMEGHTPQSNGWWNSVRAVISPLSPESFAQAITDHPDLAVAGGTVSFCIGASSTALAFVASHILCPGAIFPTTAAALVVCMCPMSAGVCTCGQGVGEMLNQRSQKLDITD